MMDDDLPFWRGPDAGEISCAFLEYKKERPSAVHSILLSQGSALSSTLSILSFPFYLTVPTFIHSNNICKLDELCFDFTVLISIDLSTRILEEQSRCDLLFPFWHWLREPMPKLALHMLTQTRVFISSDMKIPLDSASAWSFLRMPDQISLDKWYIAHLFIPRDMD